MSRKPQGDDNEKIFQLVDFFRLPVHKFLDKIKEQNASNSFKYLHTVEPHHIEPLGGNEKLFEKVGAVIVHRKQLKGKTKGNEFKMRNSNNQV